MKKGRKALQRAISSFLTFILLFTQMPLGEISYVRADDPEYSAVINSGADSIYVGLSSAYTVSVNKTVSGDTTTVSADEYTVEWSLKDSSDAEIVSLSGSTLTALQPGSATLVATVKSAVGEDTIASAVKPVTVEYAPVTSVSTATDKTLIYTKGNTSSATITATVSMGSAGATAPEVKWYKGNELISGATGTSYTFTSSEAGVFEIKAECGGKTSVENITVSKFEVASVVINTPAASATDIEVDYGYDKPWSASVNMTDGSSSSSVKWRSSNSDIVSVDDNGNVTALKASDTSVTITAYVDGSEAIDTRTIKVSKKKLQISNISFSDKTYDGSTDVENPQYTFSGLVTGDSANDLEVRDVTFSTASPNVSDNAIVTITGTPVLGENDKYILNPGNEYLGTAKTDATVNIKPAQLTIAQTAGTSIDRDYEGGSDLITEDSDTLKEKFTVTGFVNGESGSITAVNKDDWHYSSGEITADGSMTTILYVAASHFTISMDGDKLLSNYAVVFSGTVQGRISSSEELKIDLSASAIPVLTVSGDSLTFSGGVNKNNTAPYWYNSTNNVITASGTDFQGFFIYESDGTKGAEYKDGDLKAIVLPDDWATGQSSGTRKVFLKYRNRLYPLSITYCYDKTNPRMGKIEVNPDKAGINSRTDLLNDMSFDDKGMLAWNKEAISVSANGTDDESGIWKVQLWKTDSLNDSTTTSAYVPTTLDGKEFSDSIKIGENGEEWAYVYVKLTDIAGNVEYRLLDGTLVSDRQSPSANVVVNTYTDSDYTNPANNKLNITVNVADKLGVDGTNSGIASFKVELYDKDKLYKTDSSTKVHSVTNEPIVIGTNSLLEDSMTLSYDGSTSYGYQLRTCITVEDQSGNKLVEWGYIDADGNYVKNESEAFEVSRTFTLTGAQKINLSFSGAHNNYLNKAYFDVLGDRKASATVSLEQFGSKLLRFKEIGIADNNSVALIYDPEQHTYLFSDGSLTKTFDFSDIKDRKQSYKIVLNSVSNNNAEFTWTGEDGWTPVTDGSEKTIEFFADGILPSVSVNCVGDAVTRHNYVYYKDKDPDLTVIVTIEDQHLPEIADMADYVTIDTSGLAIVWEKDETNNKLTGTISGIADGYYKVTVNATDLTKRTERDSDEKEFIYDTKAPEFTIGYNDEEAFSSDGSINHYYGLVNHYDGDTVTAKASVVVKEANLYDEDIKAALKIYKDDTVVFQDWAQTGSTAAISCTLTPATFEGQPFNADNSCTLNIEILGNQANAGSDGKYYVVFDYADPAGNKMVSASANNIVSDGVYNGKTQHLSIIDTIRPVVNMQIGGDGIEYVGDAVYYKAGYSVSFNVVDTNFTNTMIRGSVSVNYYDPETNLFDEAATAITVSGNATGKYTYETTQDGSYVYGISGWDKAGNYLDMSLADCKSVISRKWNGTSLTELGSGNTKLADDDNKFNETSYEYFSGKKILDTVAPTVALKVKRGNTGSTDYLSDMDFLHEVDDERYYYNFDFVTEYTVKELNYEVALINAYYGYDKTAENYSKAAPEASSDFAGSKARVGVAGNNVTEYIYDYSVSGGKDLNGVYVFDMSGIDKAGNSVVRVTSDGTNYFHMVAGNSSTSMGSRYMVYDTVQPTLGEGNELLGITIGDFYAAKLLVNEGKAADSTDGTYIVELNHPYQQITSTSIVFKEKDRSPAFIEYEIVSTTESKSKKVINKNGVQGVDDSQYQHTFTHTVPINGQQVFYIRSITVADMAGNITTMDQPTNKFYLDVEAPKYDELTPTIQSSAVANGMGRGPEGNPLFASDVDVVINIEDPNEVVSSSGLYQLFYRVVVNGEDRTAGSTPSSATGAAGGGEVTYGTHGPSYSTDASTVDEQLTYRDTLTFHFNAADYNYNDIKVYVWGGDDAGNEIPESNAAYYAFGIDVTKPTIDVRYDNNDAQNLKYFKANRTATVTVTERNFDPEHTVITTQPAAHISGWTYQPGSLPNGDDDKWITHVLYDTDGDYTFKVTTKDLVGWEAERTDYGDSVAPEEFTIDKTLPVIDISFDNNSVLNGRYYNMPRLASIDITEHNFNANEVHVTGSAYLDGARLEMPQVNGWISGGDVRHASMHYEDDGDYTLRVEYTDLAGNVAQPVTIEMFTIDQTAPELVIEGVQNMHAYNGTVAPSIRYNDINLDGDSAEVDITRTIHKNSGSLSGIRSNDEKSGTFVCNNIEMIKENDDVYNATGSVSDLAGNVTTADVVFSVNRFGSNYILSDDTQALVDNVYINQEQVLKVTEINVNELESEEVTKALNGNMDTLVEGANYDVEMSRPGWVQYDYEVMAGNFESEGGYTVTLYSEDAAANKNTNKAIKEDGGDVSECPIEFIVDKTAPSIILSGVEEGARYRERERTIMLHYEDNNVTTRLEVKDASGNVTVYYLGDEADARAAVSAQEYIQLSSSTGDIQLRVTARNSRQSVSVTAYDAAGNVRELTSPEFLLTTNILVQFINNPVAIVVSLLILGIIIALIVLIASRRRRRHA